MRLVLLRLAALPLALALAPAARAGLYYSGETMAELPSQWRGFLLDQRLLRTAAVKPAAGAAPGPVRQRYEQAAAELRKTAGGRPLTADELADLGAVLVRLGEPAKAVEVLRDAVREHPHHFRLVTNLGTAWQLQGDLAQAEACLQQAVKLAPGKLQRAEEYHLRLVRLRQKQARDAQELDDLFGVRYIADGGKYEPGKLAEAQRKKLPADAVAVAQQLALWLPADAPLLWQLAEVAAAYGDVRTAAAMMDGCVTEFGLRAAELREHRQATRAAADELAKAGDPGTRAAHEEGHALAFKPRSSRPLATKLDAVPLPAVDPNGVNPLPWSVVTDTTVDRNFRPTFAKYLKELDGRQVTLTGYVQPLGDDPDAESFMLVEYPVGCWYCEMPEVTGIIYVELPAGEVKRFPRGQVKVTGKLVLNATDPENFLYTVRRAKVEDAE